MISCSVNGEGVIEERSDEEGALQAAVVSSSFWLAAPRIIIARRPPAIAFAGRSTVALLLLLTAEARPPWREADRLIDEAAPLLQERLFMIVIWNMQLYRCINVRRPKI